MKIKILPSSPLSPLNKLFPEGVPIVDGLELGLQGTNAYLFNPKGVSEAIMSQIFSIVMADEMPATIASIFMHDSELVIPKEWVCTDEQSTTAS